MVLSLFQRICCLFFCLKLRWCFLSPQQFCFCIVCVKLRWCCLYSKEFAVYLFVWSCAWCCLGPQRFRFWFVCVKLPWCSLESKNCFLFVWLSCHDAVLVHDNFAFHLFVWSCLFEAGYDAVLVHKAVSCPCTRHDAVSCCSREQIQGQGLTIPKPVRAMMLSHSRNHIHIFRRAIMLSYFPELILAP